MTGHIYVRKEGESLTGTKSIFLSKTAWAGLIATVTPISAMLSIVTGVDLKIQQEMVESGFIVVQGVLALAGLAGVIAGRIAAKQKVAVVLPQHAVRRKHAA